MFGPDPDLTLFQKPAPDPSKTPGSGSANPAFKSRIVGPDSGDFVGSSFVLKLKVQNPYKNELLS